MNLGVVISTVFGVGAISVASYLFVLNSDTPDNIDAKPVVAPLEISIEAVTPLVQTTSQAALLVPQAFDIAPESAVPAPDIPPISTNPLEQAGLYADIPALDAVQITASEVFQPLMPQATLAQETPSISQNSAETPSLFTAATLSLQSISPPGTAPLPDTTIPRFDIVRIDASGSTLVAGRAAPNALVNIISGGEILVAVTASANGEFVAFLDAPSEPPSAPDLSAVANRPAGIVSQAQIIILPAQDGFENAAPVVVLATQDSVQIIQPSGLSLPDNISLDTISYNAESAVVLAGRGTPNRMARIYADDQLVGTSPISASGSWGIELEQLAGGRYVLRVDEVNPDGSVASRVETPFQREFPEALALSEFSQGAKVIVQPGNTLWLMATQAYGDGDYYTQIFRANADSIRDPNLIYPGQIVSIPNVGE